jgi:hypothetical protein
MRVLVSCAVLALLSVPEQPRARSGEPDALLRDIKGKWVGKVVRDQTAPGRPVIGIEFHCTSKAPDEVIEQLVAFPQLRKLGLVGGQHLTNKGLEHIGKLTSLESLELRNGKVTSAGLRHLAKLPKLKSLTLSDVPLNKENGAALEGLKSLEVLELNEVTVSPEALASLKKLSRLKQLRGFRCDGAFTSEDEVRRRFPGVKVQLCK